MRREIRGRRNHKKGLNIFKILSILLILVFLGLVPAVIKKLITIKEIRCTTQYGECGQQLGLKIENFESRDLKTVKQRIEKQLTDSYLVENFLIQYKIPSTLDLEIVIKKPMYAIKQKGQNNFYLLSKEGFVLEQATQTELPIVEINNINLQLGQKVSEEFLFLSKLIFVVNWQYIVKSAELKNDSLFVSLDDLIVIFPTSGDINVLSGALRLIYSRLNESNSNITIENVREIDLRFRNPIIR